MYMFLIQNMLSLNVTKKGKSDYPSDIFLHFLY